MHTLVFSIVLAAMSISVYGQSERKFSHYTEIGALAATKNRPDNVTTAAFTFQTVNGYRVNPHFFVGLGAALDLYATQTILPIFASLRYDLFRNERFYPYLFVDGGYGFDITSSTTDVSYDSGAMWASGIGFKIPILDDRGFHLNIGYRVQKGAVVTSGVKEQYQNNRIALRAGFYL